MTTARDPEIAQLASSVRTLTRQAFTLSRDITGTLQELDEFSRELTQRRNYVGHERRMNTAPYIGQERRGSG